MDDPTEKPLLADLRRQLLGLGRELRELFAVRWELAQMELQADLRSTVRLAAAWLVVGLMGLTALPLTAMTLAKSLDGCCNLTELGWLAIFAAGLFILALGVGYFSWRCFRRRFVGLQETLEELREDLLWLQEKRED